MTDGFDDLRERQDRTEGRVIALEDNARIQARAFADMDRDVSDLKVQYGKQRQMLQAVGDTLSDHTRRLTRLETKVDNLEIKVDNLETKVDDLQVRVIGLETGMAEVNAKLGTVQTGIGTIIDMLAKAS